MISITPGITDLTFQVYFKTLLEALQLKLKMYLAFKALKIIIITLTLLLVYIMRIYEEIITFHSIISINSRSLFILKNDPSKKNKIHM